MKNTIVKSFNRERESDLITTGYRITEKLDNNINFPNPPEALAKLKAILPEFQAALVNAKGREKEAVSLKNDKKAQIRNYIDELARFVMASSNGDRTLLLSSGFDIYGTKVPPPVTFVDKLEVELGPPGEATSRVKRVGGIRAYMYQYIGELPTSESVWTSALSTEPMHTFKGLSSASKYWFRVEAVHYNGETRHSPIVQRIIQ